MDQLLTIIKCTEHCYIFQLSAAAAAADSVYDKLRMFNGQVKITFT